MTTITDLKEKRAKCVADARAIFDKAEKEKRAMSAEEAAQFDAFKAEADTLKPQIDAAEAGENRSRWLGESEDEMNRSPGRPNQQPGRGANGEAGGRGGDSPEERARKPIEFELRGEKFSLEPGTEPHRRCLPDGRAAHRAFLRGERRNLQTDIDTAGGFITTPEEMVAGLLKSVDDAVLIRAKARKFTTTAQTLGIMKRTAKMDTFVWASELGEPTDDTALAFGKRGLTPHYMTGSILVSRDLLRAAVMNPEQIVNDEIARDAGETEEAAFMTGHGANQPLGLFTASPDGISTGRDVSAGNTDTAMKFDGLIAAKYALKQQYRSAAEWLFHRDGVAQVMKIKDGNGNYIWQPSTQAGQPDRLLNLPVLESEFAPSTFTTGLYVGLLGVFSHYYIADALLLEIQRLVETKARQNQVEFIARRKVDGMPVLEEAFVRVKLA